MTEGFRAQGGFRHRGDLKAQGRGLRAQGRPSGTKSGRVTSATRFSSVIPDVCYRESTIFESVVFFWIPDKNLRV